MIIKKNDSGEYQVNDGKGVSEKSIPSQINESSHEGEGSVSMTLYPRATYGLITTLTTLSGL